MVSLITIFTICDPTWETTFVVHNNFEQTLTFKHSIFGNFNQEAN